MKVYSQEPKDWKELQNMTSKFMTEIEYNCEIEKDINTVRGKVKVDVLAENNKISPPSKILFECKYWDSAIPKTVIHSFRTVVSDFGANHGFIISKNGFQKGSFDASKNTNITLLTWSSFLEYFKENWIKAMTKQVNILNHDLLTYTGAGFPIFFKSDYNYLTKEELLIYDSLYNLYFNIAFYSMNHEYKDLDTNEFDLIYFERNFLKAEKDFRLKFNSYEDFYNFLVINAKQGVQEFDKLFNKKLRRKNNS
ncbi:MAG TPA: restriction endonuclease [Saprospiraceae bacterium]|nr:restriction endonuclease [Saprospiraceae bacterium]